MGLRISARDISATLGAARGFHGHVGPFLILGVRAGVIGLRELETVKENKDLRVKASLLYSLPYSCILDGLQVATGCTIGNKRLTFENLPSFTISFATSKGGAVTVSILRNALEDLKSELARSAGSQEVERLAFPVTSKAESELLVVHRRQAGRDMELEQQ